LFHDLDSKVVEAIKKSDIAIICLSRAYKISTNCQIEGKFIMQRRKKALIDTLFLTMSPAYTMDSQPDKIDGWLELMVRKAQLLPLWDSSQLASLVHKILDSISTKVNKVLLLEIHCKIRFAHHYIFYHNNTGKWN